MRAKAEVMKDLAKVRRRTITIQSKIDTEDEIGNPIEVWSNWKTVKAEQTSLWGQEYYAAAAVGQEETVVFTLKHVAFLDALDSVQHRLIYDGKAYDIKHIDPLKDDGMWLKVKAILRPTGADGIKITQHALVIDLVDLLWQMLDEIEIEEEERERYEELISAALEGW